MKKMMILAALAVTCVAANAANYKWRSLQAAVCADGTTTALSGLDAYVFDSKKTSQQAVLTAFIGHDSLTTLDGFVNQSSLGSDTMAGKVALTSEFSYSKEVNPDTWKAFMVVVNGDKIFISGLTNDIIAPYDDSPTTITILSAAVTPSQNAALKTETFGDAGWYQTVPEPTSGLLLLLGVAGLALRRRRD